MGRTGADTSIPIKPYISLLDAVIDTGSSKYTFSLYYIALSTLHSKVQTKKLLQLGRTPTLPNSCFTRNNYAPRGTVRYTFCTPPSIPFCRFYTFSATWIFFNSYTFHTKIVKSRAVCMLRPRFNPLALVI